MYTALTTFKRKQLLNKASSFWYGWIYEKEITLPAARGRYIADASVLLNRGGVFIWNFAPLSGRNRKRRCCAKRRKESVTEPSGTQGYEYPHRRIEKLDYSKLTAEYQFKNHPYGFDSLEEGEERRLYQCIMDAAYDIAQDHKASYYDYDYEAGRVETGASFSDIRFYKVLTAFLIDNPQIFWINSDYDFTTKAAGAIFSCTHLFPQIKRRSSSRIFIRGSKKS